jgi:hypothetical protein
MPFVAGKSSSLSFDVVGRGALDLGKGILINHLMTGLGFFLRGKRQFVPVALAFISAFSFPSAGRRGNPLSMAWLAHYAN